MEDAIKRGVKIYLGYGYSKQFETHQMGAGGRKFKSSRPDHLKQGVTV